jgi:hypothetical protein
MQKPSRHFKSMDEVKAFIDKHKASISNEEYNTLLIITGLGDQEGKFVELESIGKIDNTIVNVVKTLNSNDYITNSSCSGVRSEHPKWSDADFSGYISIVDDGNDHKKNVIRKIADELNLSFHEEEVYLKPSYTIRVKGSDEHKKKAWNRFSELLDEGLSA